MKLKYYIYSFLASVIIIFSACTPDDFNLGKKDVTSDDLVEGIAFTVTPDTENPNLIHLKSNMKGYTCLWNHPQGRSQEESVDLQLAFPGKYTVTFGVETRGGIVYGEPYEFEVTTTYLGFVQDDLWTYLTGGVGESKTWIPNDYDYDLGALGELTYADPSSNPEFDNWSANWDPGKGVTDDDGIFNSSMTFSLSAETGTTVTIVNGTEGAVAEQTGTYMLDKDAHTLTFTDCSILHTQSWDAKASNWKTGLKVLTLNENFLQVAIWRDTSDEGEWWMVLNFVSKDFADSFTKVEAEPTLPDNWKDDISQNVVTTVKWTLSSKTPFNWTDLTGALSNSWSSLADYPDWGWGTLDPAQWANFSMTLNSADKTVEFSDLAGNQTSGTYDLDDKGFYTFTGVSLPTFTLGSSSTSWLSFHADDNGQLRVLSIVKDALGNVAGMWVGARTTGKPEYTAYLLIPSSASIPTDPSADWKKALAGKTFVPDVNWFIDWINFDSTGGWTSESTFGDDYVTNSWVWTADVRQVAESASLTFEQSGNDITAILDYTKFDGTKVNVSGKVDIDTEVSALTFDFPMVDYIGTPGAWLSVDNSSRGAYFTEPLTQKEWLFISHGDSNLSNIATKGIWLGAISNAKSAGDGKDEILVFHWIVK